jgi:hypothetical protein
VCVCVCVHALHTLLFGLWAALCPQVRSTTSAAAHFLPLPLSQGVTTPEHMSRSEFVSTFRRAKYNLVLCSYSFELLLAYVQVRSGAMCVRPLCKPFAHLQC